jgi:hypothetical protein
MFFAAGDLMQVVGCGAMAHLRLAILSLTVSLMVVLPAVEFGTFVPQARGESLAFTLYANAYGWTGVTNCCGATRNTTNPTIYSTLGETVNLFIVGGDNHLHMFLLDIDRDGPSSGCSAADICSGIIGVGQTSTISFVANFSEGPYRYYDYFYPNASGLFEVQLPGLSQYPSIGFSSPSPFVFVNEDNYLTAITNGSSLKQLFVIHGYNDFNGTVDLSAIAPDRISVTIEPSSIVLIEHQDGGWSQGFYNLTIAGNTPGTFNIAIVATSGTIANTLKITVVVTDGPDFLLTPTYPYSTAGSGYIGSPEGYTGMRIEQGMLVMSTGFQGIVTLSTQVSPPGLIATLAASEFGGMNSRTITRYVKAGGSNYTFLSFNSTVAADYAVTVVGTGGTLTHNTPVLFRVRDFALSVNPVTSRFVAGRAPAVSRITVAPLNGFSSRVNFTVSAPPGFSVALSSGNVTGSGTVFVSVAADSVSSGTYSVVVYANTLPYFSHSITLTIQVRAPYLPLYTLPVIAAIAVSGIGAAIYLLHRKNMERREDQFYSIERLR